MTRTIHAVLSLVPVTLAAHHRVWDEIWAKRGLGWDANPWVWAIAFRRVQP